MNYADAKILALYESMTNRGVKFYLHSSDDDSEWFIVRNKPQAEGDAFFMNNEMFVPAIAKLPVIEFKESRRDEYALLRGPSPTRFIDGVAA